MTGKPINVADLYITKNANGTFDAGQIATKDTLPTDKPYVVEAEMKLTDTGGSAGGFWSSNPAEKATDGSETKQIGSWLNEIDGPEYLTNGQTKGNDSASDGNLFYSIHQGVPNTLTTHVVENVNGILKDEPTLADGQTETLQNSFHNYSVSVNPTDHEDTFYFDGQKVYTASDANNYAPANWIVNADIGGAWQGNTHNNDGPFGPANGTEVEYMKAFQQD